MNYESCEKEMEVLVEWYSTNEGKRNEATVRLQMIDRLFLGCLGWEASDIKAEDRVVEKNKYIDYMFSSAGKNVLVVEAKKEDKSFTLPAEIDKQYIYSLQTLIKTNKEEIGDAIKQASGYCKDKGVPLACVTNGHQVIIFAGSRTDGISPLTGKAIVFASLGSMQKNFSILYQCLSKAGIEDKGFYQRLGSSTFSVKPSKPSGSLMDYDCLEKPNEMQEDLDLVSDLIFNELISNESIEEKFLQECYCQGGELSEHIIASKEILEARYWALSNLGISSSPVKDQQIEESGFGIKSIREKITRKPIVILGDINVGKTTFIRNFITIEAQQLLTKSFNIYIDLRSQATLEANLKEFILKEISEQLKEKYNFNIEERNFVRGVYRDEAKNFGKGIYSDLKKIDQAAYIRKETDFFEGKLKDRPNHVVLSLRHAVVTKKKEIVIFLDNADQRNHEDQRTTFLVAQELANNLGVTVFIALRPETFAKLESEGISVKHYPKIFTIDPPSLEKVIEKRLNFALKLARGDIKISSVPDLTVDLKKFISLAESLIFTLNNKKDIPECIENVCGGDVSLALKLIRNIFFSPHISQEKILESQKEYVIPFYLFLRSIIFGKFVYYHPDESMVANIFDVSTLDKKEHFLIPILLSYLERKNDRAGGFNDIAEIYDFLQGIGFSPDQIDSNLSRAIKGGIIENNNQKIRIDGDFPSSMLRITPKGAYHVKKICSDFNYIEAITIDTPILDLEKQKELSECRGDNLDEKIKKVSAFHTYLDDQWVYFKDKRNVPFDWAACSTRISSSVKDIKGRIRKK